MMGDEVILDDVCTSFRTDSAKSRETVANVAKAGQLVLEVAGIARNKENQIVQIIREMMQEEEKLQQQAETPPATEFIRQQDVLRERHTAVKQRIAKLETQLNMEKTRLKASTDNCTELEKNKDAEIANAQRQLPMLRSTLKLYKNISGIDWDYTSRGDMKGFCHFKRHRTIRKFDINKTEHTVPEAADALWDLMWQDHASTE